MHHLRVLTKAQPAKAQTISPEKQENLDWFNFYLDVIATFLQVFGPKVL
jgi:hypothetical protein